MKRARITNIIKGLEDYKRTLKNNAIANIIKT